MMRPIGILLMAGALTCQSPSASPSGDPTITSAGTTGASTKASALTASAPSSSSGSTAVTRAAGIHFVIRHSAGALPDATLPMVVAIHGLGDRPAKFSRILANYHEPARLIFPRATTRHGRGFSWFGRGSQRAAGVRRAADQLAAMIAELTQRYPTRGKPVVTGFSQGGMLSFALAVLHPSVISAAIPLAGALPVELVPKQAGLSSPPILALHGDADPVLPIEPTRELTQLLRARGFQAQLTEYPAVTHTVSAPMHRAMTGAIVEATRDPTP